MSEALIQALVAEIIDETTIVINKGSLDGVKIDNRYIVYNMGKMIIDPETNEELGRLELICGEGKPKHIQERVTTLKSAIVKVSKGKTTRLRNGILPYSTHEEVIDQVEEVTPFDGVRVGSLVRRIR